MANEHGNHPEHDHRLDLPSRDPREPGSTSLYDYLGSPEQNPSSTTACQSSSSNDDDDPS